MPARSDESIPLPSDDDTLDFELCEQHLLFLGEDQFALGLWHCQRPLGHVGRHHSWAIESSMTLSFDTDEVEMWWPNPNDPERGRY